VNEKSKKIVEMKDDQNSYREQP